MREGESHRQYHFRFDFSCSRIWGVTQEEYDQLYSREETSPEQATENRNYTGGMRRRRQDEENTNPNRIRRALLGPTQR